MGSELVVVLLSIVVVHCVADTRIDFFLSAQNLPNMDIFNGKPDAYVKVSYAGRDSDPYAVVGRTRPIDDNNNPNWTELFNFYLYGDGSPTKQKIKFSIYDKDFDLNDFIGFVEIRLHTLVTTNDLYREITPRGNGILNIKSIINSTFDKELLNDDRFNHPPTQIISFGSHFPQVGFGSVYNHNGSM